MNEYRNSLGRVYKTMPVKAPRGDILDRYGRPLATNKMGFSIQIQKTEISSEKLNEIILNVINILDNNEDIDQEVYNDTFPVTYPPFEFAFVDDEKETSLDKELNWKTSMKLEPDITASDVIHELKKRYEIPEEWEDELEIRKMIGIRYEITN